MLKIFIEAQKKGVKELDTEYKNQSKQDSIASRYIKSESNIDEN